MKTLCVVSENDISRKWRNPIYRFIQLRKNKFSDKNNVTFVPEKGYTISQESDTQIPLFPRHDVISKNINIFSFW